MSQARLHALSPNRTPRPSLHLRLRRRLADMGWADENVISCEPPAPASGLAPRSAVLSTPSASAVGSVSSDQTRRWIGHSVAVIVFLLAGITPVWADVDAAKVQRSIDRGITYLRKTQGERGGWREYPGQSCGLSALCTLALLNSGVPRDDPALIRSMRYLRSCEPSET